MTSLQCQKKNGLEYAARPFANLNKVTPENKKKIETLASCRTADNVHPLSESVGTTTVPTTTTVTPAAATLVPPQPTSSNPSPNPNNSMNRKRY